MKFLQHLFLLTHLLLPSFASGYASDIPATVDTLSLTVYFRRSESEIDMSFRDNGRILAEFVRELNAMNADSSVMVREVNVTTGASPEGADEFNEKIAMGRARAVKNHLLANTSLPASCIKVFSLGADWDGFSEMIVNGSDPAREEIMEIISCNGLCAEMITMLKDLSDGMVWERLEEEVLCNLRKASGTVSFTNTLLSDDVPPLNSGKDTLVLIRKDTVFNFVRSNPPLARLPVASLRSNLLFPLVNIGIEIPVSDRISLEADFYSPWVMRGWIDNLSASQKNCFQLVCGMLGCRFWLDPRYALCGHSLSIVTSGGKYDFERNWKGQQGEFAFVGVDYLYAVSVGRGGVHFEFNVGIGCGINRYHNYDVRYEGGKLIGNGEGGIRPVLVPARFGVSLAVPIYGKVKTSDDGTFF